jgi:hypothetical protein
MVQFLSNPDLQQNFHTPLSQQALQELTQLEQMIEQAQQTQLDKDVWDTFGVTANTHRPDSTH